VQGYRQTKRHPNQIKPYLGRLSFCYSVILSSSR
jgi:hypothetical protein